MKQLIEIIGAPLDFGASRRGANGGPAALRVAGLSESLAKQGHEIINRSDISVPLREQCQVGDEQMRYKAEILAACQALSEITYSALEHGHIPLVLGGDHSIAMGSMSGVSAFYRKQQKSIGLLWFDAHSDINLPDISPTGNIHGMPLAHLLGSGDKDFAGLMGDFPKVNPEQVVLVGIRDIDHEERAMLKNSGVRFFTMRDIDELGMARVADEAIEIITHQTAGFHLSFDVDGCDPEYMPGTGLRIPGGPSFREAHLLLEKCADTGLMTSMDLVELNPFVDIENVTAERAVHLICSAFGSSIV